MASHAPDDSDDPFVGINTEEQFARNREDLRRRDGSNLPLNLEELAGASFATIAAANRAQETIADEVEDADSDEVEELIGYIKAEAASAPPVCTLAPRFEEVPEPGPAARPRRSAAPAPAADLSSVGGRSSATRSSASSRVRRHQVSPYARFSASLAAVRGARGGRRGRARRT